MRATSASPRAALTAVELMVALALSLLVLLVAISGFRMASSAMGKLERLSEENALMRSGWFLCEEDVDFWNSQANPEYPYGKGFMSDDRVEVVRGDRGNNHANKRPFRPVTFTRGVAWSDPNWLQPNDRRTWYRNGALPSPAPMPYDRYENRQRTAFALADAPDNAVYPKLPPGWEPWHMGGDYSVLGNCGDDGDGAPRDAATGSRPLLTWNLFKELGHAGVYTYLPPGTPNLILRPSDNLTADAIGDQARNYDKGEVPWSLTVPARLATGPGGIDPSSVTVPSLPDNVLGHYAYAMPGRSGMRADTGWRVRGGGVWNGWDWLWRPASARFGISDPYWLADLEAVNAGYDQSVALLTGARLVATDLAATTLDAGPIVDGTTADPWRSLGRSTIWGLDPNTPARDEIAQWLADRDYADVTWHVPRNRTDDPAPDLADRPAGSAALATQVLRARLRGADRAMCLVRIEDPTSGLVHELGFTLVGTTLRGARQHWGWKTRWDRPAMRDMGDDYR